MHIPENGQDRREFYVRVMRACLESRGDRLDFYEQCRNYYLFGTPDTSGCEYNKISATVDQLWSFCYSSDTSKFTIHLGTKANAGDLMKSPKLRSEINDQWREGGASAAFSVGGKYSLVYGAMLFKTLWHRGTSKTFPVEPGQFGVYREDVMDLDDQEAFVHCYKITRSQLAAQLDGNPRAREILERAGRRVETDENADTPSGLGRIIVSSTVDTTGDPSQSGGAIDGGIGAVGSNQYDYRPMIDIDMIDMRELWVWNDAISDYQIVTIAEPDVIVFDRRNFYLNDCSPFSVCRPENDVIDYFWGTSYVARLTKLQEQRTKRLSQVWDLLDKQADPPMLGSGMSGISEEKFRALRSSGGQVSTQAPGAKIDTLVPTLPPSLFSAVQEIDAMFGDSAGLGGVMQGSPAGSVRSKGQADLMARLGSSRVKQKALEVERAAGHLATKLLKVFQKNSAQRFESEEKGPDGQPLTFVAEQFTSDFEVRVDSHSSSPVFMEDRRQDAEVMLKAGAIGPDTLLEMFDPPNLQELLAKYKVIEANKQKIMMEQLELEKISVEKSGKPPKKSIIGFPGKPAG